MLRIALAVAAVTLFSCGTKETELVKDAESDSVVLETGDSIVEEVPPLLLWEVDDLKQSKKRNPDFKPEWIQADTLVNCINRVYPEPGLFIQKKSGDTIFLGLRHPLYLTEQMGSTGAASYIAELVINLTAVSDVRYVKLEMKRGSHAGPDTWSREDFMKYKEQND